MEKKTEKKKVRNGKIELLRFMFCMFVLLHHINKDYAERKIRLGKDLNFFVDGRIGVEFFFIVTGYLTAMGIYKHLGDETPIGVSTWEFMKKKIAGIIDFHILAILVAIFVKLRVVGKGIRLTLIDGFPSIFLLQMTGLPGKNLVNVEWYISSMLMALLIIYPLCKKYYDVFTHIVAPFLGFGCVGYVVHRAGLMDLPKKWIGYTYLGNIIAVGCICLGIFIFELIRTIKEKENNILEQHRGLVSCFELFGYAFVFFFIVSEKIPSNFGGIITILLSVLVGISFSEISYGQKYFNNRFNAFLGKLSLPMYLVQNPVRASVSIYCGKEAFSKIVILDVGLCLVIALIMMLIVELYKRYRRAKKAKLSQ